MSLFLRFPGFRRKAVTLSYDDGVVEDKQLIDILNRHGLKGTFNINSELFTAERRLKKDEIIKLFSGSPHEVAVHGARHLSLTEVDEALATRDVLRDRENLETIFERIIKGMAYANGATNGRVINILKHCGIKYARTAGQTESFYLPEDWYRWTGTCHHNHPKLMDLANPKLMDLANTLENVRIYGMRLMERYMTMYRHIIDWNTLQMDKLFTIQQTKTYTFVIIRRMYSFRQERC